MPEIVFDTQHPKPCVDLRATFGTRFKYVWDPSYAAERGDFRKLEARWLTRIPCRLGYLFPWGGRQIAAYSNRRGVFARLRPLGQIRQEGQGELVITFDVDQIDAVAELLEARKPIQLSPEERARRQALGRVLAERRWGNKTGGQSEPESTTDAPDDL